MDKIGIPIILSAPSGTGKTTICKILRERFPELKFSVSHTTRPPRKGEQEGVDYFFISEDDFQKKIKNGDLVEWAKVHNHYYGTAKETVEDHRKNGDDLIFELDVQGVESLRKLSFSGIFIFILPPSLEELEKRLIKRGTEEKDKIKERIKVGEREILKYALYDYVVINRDVDEAIDTIQAIIKAEKARSSRYKPQSPDIKKIFNSREKT